MNRQLTIAYYIFILLLLVQPVAGATVGSPKDFIPGSFAEIVTTKSGKPFIVSLWSVDCPPCIRELKLWSELYEDHPNMEVVLISIDGTEARPTINAVLQKTLSAKAIQEMASWVFADEFVERLRFEVDPQWYGELPRTVFFTRQHKRHSVSGLLERQDIEQWIQRQTQ